MNDMNDQRSLDDILTVRLPRWAWDGIVEGIERWTGRRVGDIQILDAAEVEPQAGAEFDQWLRQVRAEAWDEGHGMHDWVPNPYREEQ